MRFSICATCVSIASNPDPLGPLVLYGSCTSKVRGLFIEPSMIDLTSLTIPRDRRKEYTWFAACRSCAIMTFSVPLMMKYPPWSWGHSFRRGSRSSSLPNKLQRIDLSMIGIRPRCVLYIRTFSRCSSPASVNDASSTVTCEVALYVISRRRASFGNSGGPAPFAYKSLSWLGQPICTSRRRTRSCCTSRSVAPAGSYWSSCRGTTSAKFRAMTGILARKWLKLSTCW
mmetsp:Transcript_47178/g.145504  ORF Transcript_47178/g.145504 Transcript_47178/m.145504 type:complete len:228 (-) Transcript_47178:125-808(-)